MEKTLLMAMEQLPALCEKLFDLGIDVISSGNHIWDQETIIPYIAKQNKLLRPVNYDNKFPGKGIGSFTDKNGNKIIVINILCNLFMQKSK